MSARIARGITTALLVILVGGCDVEQDAGREENRSDGALEQAQVVRIVDGDTIIARIDGREERLRYIGIDAPESVSPDEPVECFGPESSDANARLLGAGTVYLEADIENRDRFGRLLRYVYVPAAGDALTMVNHYLVEQGYAEASSYPPNDRYQDDLFAAERVAINEDRGLWSSCP